MQTRSSRPARGLRLAAPERADDHGLPWHEQHDGKSKQAMDHRCEPGRDGRPSGKGQATGRSCADKDHQQVPHWCAGPHVGGR